jgi:short-subunit dehydrogenase
MPSPDAALKNFSAVIITGGSSGIGKSFIELCANLRPDLEFCNLSRRAPVINASKLNLRHIACDLAQPARLQAALADIHDFLRIKAPQGRILLVNNSGFGVYGRFLGANVAQQLEMLDVNVRAVLQLTGALLPTIKARGGAVINVASTAAFQPTAYLDTYGATKAFLLHWSLGLSEELRGTGVSALAVCPGPTSSEFFRRAGLGENPLHDPMVQTCEEVVLAALKALAAGKSLVVSGWKNKVGAALVTKLPKTFAARVTAVVMARYRVKRMDS